jgi:hypothetical protein
MLILWSEKIPFIFIFWYYSVLVLQSFVRSLSSPQKILFLLITNTHLHAKMRYKNLNYSYYSFERFKELSSRIWVQKIFLQINRIRQCCYYHQLYSLWLIRPSIQMEIISICMPIHFISFWAYSQTHSLIALNESYWFNENLIHSTATSVCVPHAHYIVNIEKNENNKSC